jgi:hypothetical protein
VEYARAKKLPLKKQSFLGSSPETHFYHVTSYYNKKAQRSAHFG